jgi:hypothetical protein
MGNSGYALSDDETSLFYNPAGLGLLNYRWNGGALTYHYEPVELGFSKYFVSIAYQDDKLNRFGFSGYFDYAGSNNYTDNIGSYQIYTYAIAVGLGYNFYSNKLIDNSLGLAVKFGQYINNVNFFNYPSPSSKYDEKAIACDFGYILQFIKRFRLSVSFRNIGPDKQGVYHDASIGTSIGKNKMPFNFGTGIGYKDSFNRGKIRILDISTEISYAYLSRYNNSVIDYNPSMLIMGIDLNFLKSFSIRAGYMNGFNNNIRNTLSCGLGMSLFNHFDIDAFLAHDNTDPGYFYEDGPIGFSISLKRILNWSISDLKWWRNW